MTSDDREWVGREGGDLHTPFDEQCVYLMLLYALLQASLPHVHLLSINRSECIDCCLQACSKCLAPNRSGPCRQSSLTWKHMDAPTQCTDRDT